jgi:branched-chain amino acid transport system permease protein
MDVAFSIAFQALAYAMVLYLISVGLSVIMGLMGFVNLAHGAFAMFGGYVAIELVNRAAVPWILAVLIAAAVVGVFSLVLEKLLFSRLYGADELAQVLFCIGFLTMASAMARWIWGPLMLPMPLPPALAQNVTWGGASFSVYKVLVIVVGLSIILAITFGIERTRFGARVRASVENRGMAESVGINTRLLYSVTFGLGCALAAIGGAVGADILSITPNYGFDYLIYFMIVVSIAGLGTVKGAFIASFLVAAVQSLSGYFIPELGTLVLFICIPVILLLKPQGFFGRL